MGTMSNEPWPEVVQNSLGVGPYDSIVVTAIGSAPLLLESGVLYYIKESDRFVVYMEGSKVDVETGAVSVVGLAHSCTWHKEEAPF